MSPEERVCPHCGKAAGAQAVYCSYCGKVLDAEATGETPPASVGGDQIEARVDESAGVALGEGAQAFQAGEVRGAVIQAQGAVQGDIITADTVMIHQQASAKRRASRRQVLPPPDYYIPRQEVEGALQRLLMRHTDQLNVVELYGLPGSGKSMLSRKVATDLEGEFPDGTLWVDVEGKTAIDVLSSLIEPFEEPPQESPFRDNWQYLDALQRALADKRVLIVLNRVGQDDEGLVRAVLPEACSNVAVLVVSGSRLPGLIPAESSVYLQEMSAQGAVTLFRNVWKDAYVSTSSEVIGALAEELSYLPTQIVLVARDILNRQVSPADYLEEMRLKKGERQFSVAVNNPGLQVVYENLPAEGQAVLPFVGAIGSREWDLDTLAALSQMKPGLVAVALRQLEAAGFFRVVPETGDYRCTPVVRDFALARLRELGGEALERSSRAVMAHYALRQALETSRHYRQSLLDDFLSDEARKESFIQVLKEVVLPSVVESHHGDTSVTVQATPGLGDVDFIQEAFEKLVLAEAEYLKRWTELLNTDQCLDQRCYLEEALEWAVQKEDWSLVRRFASLSIGAFVSELIIAAEEGRILPMTIKGVSFGPLRGLDLAGVQLDSNLRAARLIEPKISRCELVTTHWAGVHLYRPSLAGVDMVSAHMPGLVVQDGTFIDVDLRGADLRGAIFYNCYFVRANFRYANMEGAEFINSGGSDVDLRGTDLDGASFHRSTFKDVIYYEADQARFKELMDTEAPTGPLRGRVSA